MSEEILSLDLDNLDSPYEQEKLDILSRDLLQELFIRSLKRTVKMNDKITQLTNNWNELRKRIKEYLEECENSDDEWLDGKCDMARDILYDMEEIKEGNK